jgi:nitroreductase
VNDVIKTIKERRSVRAYDTARQLSDADLDLILEAGRYAPTAHNEQPWYFNAVQNKELLESINLKANAVMAESDNEWLRGLGTNPDFRATYNAPTVIFVSGRDGAMAAETDCALAIMNMMNAAWSLGIGSVFVGLLWPYITTPEAPAELKIPEGYKLLHAVAFGYPSGPKLPAPPRNTDVVTYIR